MKLAKPTENLYTISELSHRFNISKRTLAHNCGILGLRPTTHEGKHQYLLTAKQVEQICDYKERRFEKSNVPEVIYVTRTIEILESKMNFIDL